MIGSAHYTISMDSSNLSKNSPGYLGKVRSDNVGTEYNLFSEGENPATTQIPELVRNQLLAVQYVYAIDNNRNKPIQNLSHLVELILYFQK